MTRGKNLDHLMSMLKLSEQNPSELLFKDVILDKPEGRRVEHIEHTYLKVMTIFFPSNA